MSRILFGNRGTSARMPVTALQTLIENLKASTQGQGPLVGREVATAAISMESMDSRVQADLQTAVQNLDSMIHQSVAGVADRAKLSVAQEDAAAAAGVASFAIESFMRKEVSSSSAIKAAFANENTVVIGHNSANGATDTRSFRMEAFDEKENKNATVYSVAYNMEAARQDEFGEAFFPTVTVTPDNVGFSISIRLMFIYDEVRRELNGSLDKWNRKNVIKAVIDPTILRNDQTRIVPVFRKSTPAAPTDSDAMFAADVGTTTVMLDGQAVTTGALAIGKRLSLLGISQTEALLATGQQDQTDAIDSSIRLSAIYMKIADGAAVNVIKFKVEQLAGTDFNAAPQGNSRQMSLNFSTDSLYVTAATKGIDGALPSILGAALGNNTVRLGVSVFGGVRQDTSQTSVNASEVEVTKVMDDAGNVLAQDTGIGATVANLFANAEVVGYDLIAYRTNSNRRQRGQLIDTQYMNYLYTVPLLPPITALRPVGDTEVNDHALLASLLTTTRIRTSNAAVGALLEAKDFLADFVNNTDSINDAPEILGVARYLVNPAYAEAELDCETALDSLSHSDRTEDLQSLIVNKLRDMAYRLYTASGYKAACDALYAGTSPKPMVIIGTDPILARYLQLSGDLRTMGDFFDFKLVSTLDNRMTGKIMFSFGMESSFNSGVPNPMHFGNMAWKPELTVMMPMIRNGSHAMELTVQPSFRHVVNLPIIGSLIVKNIESVIASKVSIYNHVVV